MPGKNSLYKFFIRPILFRFDPEKIHHFTFGFLKFLFSVPGIPAIFRLLFNYKNKNLEREIFGLKFSNPVGLAAGFDKDGRIHESWGNLGFGFAEIGTITPRPQEGNPKKRLFRLPSDNALLNRMGFNNAGAAEISIRLKIGRKGKLIIGGNIGKNKDTAIENSTEDYIECMNALHPFVDYFVVNVSSPNTPGLRTLQEKAPLKQLLSELVKQNRLHSKPRPLLLKISPDLSMEQLDEIIEIVKEEQLDGIVATNTTLDRENLIIPKKELEVFGIGGISGAPIKNKSTEIIRRISEKTGGKLPVIGVGGIMSPEDALEKIRAGAWLVQVYTGFIYEGPAFARKINRFLSKNFADGVSE